jgi:adenine-specific DNA-methyltransferase
MDEVFGASNRIATISFATTSGSSTNILPQVSDYYLWYAMDKNKAKYRQLYEPLSRQEIIDFFSSYAMVELPDGKCRRLNEKERFNPNEYLPKGSRIYRRTGLDSQGASTTGRSEPYVWEGTTYHCSKNRHWSISAEAMDKLGKLGRLDSADEESSLMWKKYEDEVPGRRINNLWPAQMYASEKQYVVQTATSAIQRCLLMTTDPGDVVVDITCGGGTTAYVAEQWGRRWITCDTSRVAITLSKQRLISSNYEYYKLAHPSEGVSSGFEYRTVPKVSPKILANEEPSSDETLYDQPFLDTKRNRVTGPFTVEAVPAPTVKSFDEMETSNTGISDTSLSRTGETLRQSEWREELFRTGVRGKNGQYIMFSRIEPMSGTRYIQAEGETKWSDAGKNTVKEPSATWKPQKVLICFGPEHAPLEQRTVEEAWQEARPFKPDILLFCAFQFDEEAAKDIDELKPEQTGMQLLKVQMNADLLTDDLRKKRSSNESFWLIGQPEVEMKEIKKGPDKGKFQVEVMGFDYYNPKTGVVESGGKNQIAMWMLDTDYDNRSLFPSQVFFPLAGANEGWSTLAKNLRAEIDEEKIEKFRGAVSLPFELGGRKQVAVKIVDDRGIESLKIVRM